MASTQPAIRASAKPIANRFAAAARALDGPVSGGISAGGRAPGVLPHTSPNPAALKSL